MKTINELISIAENNDWKVSRTEYKEDGKACYELETYSDMGQDFIATLWVETGEGEAESLKKELDEYIEYYDPFDEAMLWVKDGHGVNGAPDDPRDIIQDMEDCRDMMKELLEAWEK